MLTDSAEKPRGNTLENGGGHDVAVRVRQLADGRHEGALLHVVCHAGECHIETLITGIFDQPAAAAASAQRMLATFCASVLPTAAPPTRRSEDAGPDMQNRSTLAGSGHALEAAANLNPCPTRVNQ
jgi:hypothetical protein